MKAEIHWNLQKKAWTVHTYKGCEWAEYVRVTGGWETEVKPEKKDNPRGWVKVDRSQVEILEHWDGSRGQQLRYDKHNMTFNITAGQEIIFTPDGAYLL